MSQLTAVGFKSDSLSTLYHVVKSPYFHVAGLVVILAGLAFLQLRKLFAGSGAIDEFREELWEITSSNSPVQSFKAITFSSNGQYVIYSSMAALKYICQVTGEGAITDATQDEHRRAKTYLHEKIRESGATVVVHVLDQINGYQNYAGQEDIHSQFPAIKYYEMPIFHERQNLNRMKDVAEMLPRDREEAQRELALITISFNKIGQFYTMFVKLSDCSTQTGVHGDYSFYSTAPLRHRL